MCWLRPLLTSAIWICLGGNIGMAQRIRIGSEPSCPRCRIEWYHVVTLAENSDHPISGKVATMARASDGTIYLSEAGERIPHVYAADGKFVKILGRKGGGPGEYQSASIILLGDGDIVHVLDPVLGRHTVVAADGRTLGSTPFPGGVSIRGAVILPGGHIVTNHIFRDRDGAGFPLQELDERGNRVRVFGDEMRYGAGGARDWQMVRKLFARRNGEVWAARPFAYVVELYSSERTKLKELIRSAEWFEPLANELDPSSGTESRPPTTEMTDLWEDATGLLWTTTLVPRADWRSRVARESPGPRDKRYNTIIEVLDPVHGRLVTSLRVDPMVLHALSSGYVASWSEQDDGRPRVDVWQVQLKRP